MRKYDAIVVYTKEQAIADGILFQSEERYKDRNIIFTTNLIAKLKKKEIIAVLIKGLKEFAKLEKPDLKEMKVSGREIWIDDNGQDLTFLLPEDY